MISEDAEARTGARYWDAIIALGSNVGNKAQNIDDAISALCHDGAVRLVKRSRNFRTPPWGVMDQDWFVNSCAAVATEVSPLDLLNRCQQVERALGRIRTQRWGPRVIDLDILFYRGESLETESLVLPHPRITERAFVLAPLCDIAPDLVVKGKMVCNWLRDADGAGVVPLQDQADK